MTGFRLNSSVLRILTILVLTALHGLLNAQSPNFRNFSADNGLSSSEVYQIKQDSKGYIWIATDFGVCRYDGNKFTYFNSQNGLADNTVFQMFEDHKGRMWFYTFSGKIFYWESGKIKAIPQNSSLSVKIFGSKVTSIYVDKGDTIWLGIKPEGFLYKIAPNGTQGFINRSFQGKIVAKRFPQNELVWGISRASNSLAQLDLIGVTEVSHISLPVEIEYEQHQFLLSWADGTFALAVKNTLTVFNKNGVIGTKEFPNSIIGLKKDGESVWVGMRYGGACRVMNKLAVNGASSTYLPDRSVSCVLKDHEGGYWFSTLEAGIFYTPSLDILSYTTSNSRLTDNKITSIVGWQNGYLAICQSNNRLYSLGPKGQLESVDAKINAQGIQAVYIDQNNELLVGSEDGDVLAFSAPPEIKFKREYKVGLNGAVKKIVQDNSGKLWLTKSACAVKLDVPKSEIYFFTYARTKQVSRLLGEAICIYRDSVFVGGLNGLWVLIAGKYECLGKDHPLLSKRIVDLKNDKKGRMWMATRGEGLIIKTGALIKQLTAREGLASDFVNNIYIDGTQIWVSTNRGISVIEEDSGSKTGFKIINYTKAHGLISDQVNAVYKNGNSVWVATSGGLSNFKLSKYIQNSISPPIYVSDISVDGEVQKLSDNFSLSSGDHALQFEFEGITFKTDQKVKYRYRLKGIEKSWNYSENTSVKYTGLHNGHFVFEVQAANNDGVWSTRSATVRFEILPAFYNKWWFPLLLIIAVICLIWLAFYTYYQRQRNREQIQIQLAESEQKAMRAQLNPHFMFNSLNAVQKFIMQNDKRSSSIYLSKFSKLMRAILENSRFSYVSIAEELSSIELYLELEALRFEPQFSFHIFIDNQINRSTTLIPGMLIQPFLENAVNHGFERNGKAGELNLEILKNGEDLEVIITDNGIGRERASLNRSPLHTSMGQQLTSTRIDLLNMNKKNKIKLNIEDLYSEDGEATGTRVKITIPVKISK